MPADAGIACLDLSGFSSYTRARGDLAAADLARSLEAHVRSGLAGFGEVIKTLGDGSLLLGDGGNDFSRAVNDIVGSWNISNILPLRAIVSHGSVVRAEDDVYGDLVNRTFHALAEVPPGVCRSLPTRRRQGGEGCCCQRMP